MTCAEGDMAVLSLGLADGARGEARRRHWTLGSSFAASSSLTRQKLCSCSLGGVILSKAGDGTEFVRFLKVFLGHILNKSGPRSDGLELLKLERAIEAR